MKIILFNSLILIKMTDLRIAWINDLYVERFRELS